MLKSKYYKLLPVIALALCHWAAPLSAAASPVPSLPQLNWEQRSDWVNVKKDVKPVAYGDGIHDDTAALQAGLNLLNRGWYGRKTLFLPTGTYRITKTLSLSQIHGAALIGQGRSTRILWDGPRNLPMYWSNGVDAGRYVGIVWDGAGKANVGVDHQSKTFYEGSTRHQDEAFVNFPDSGIRVGFHQVVPTSEITFRNCLFQKCGSGVSFLSANDYNNNFDGCEFRQNLIGINCRQGNVYVRDCHFEQSNYMDVYLCSHSHSIRRCTSVGSRLFVFVPGAGSACPLTLQDCHVDAWTGSQGAVMMGMRGPTTVFDCSFTHPPSAKAPIQLVNAPEFTQMLILSNNSAPNSPQIVDEGRNGHTSLLPAGVRGPSVSDANISFFKSSETLPRVIMDVKKVFGATGEGKKDDTAALLNALDTAKAIGSGTMVYLPAGDYIVSQTLPIIGGQYTVEGSGHDTRVIWRGPKNGVVFGVQDPQGVALKHLSISAHLDTACIRQTSAGASSSRMTYEQLWVSGTVLGKGDTGGAYGHVTNALVGRGLECASLPTGATVLMDDFYGSNHYTNCSQAVILGDFVSGGVLQVDGAQYAKTGFLGFLAHNACLNLCDVVVKDNQDLVGTNFYTEQTQSALSVSGNGAMLGQSGHVTIQGSKTQTYDPIAIRVNDYEGQVSYVNAGITSSTAKPIAQVGQRPLDLVLLGNTFVGVAPQFPSGGNIDLTAIGNCVFSTDRTKSSPMFDALPNLTSAASTLLLSSTPVSTSISQNAASSAVAALDDFRLLGAVDLALNYP